MKRVLNTLFVMTQGASVCHEGESVLVRADDETRLRVPIHLLDGVVCFGAIFCTPSLLGLCAERGVTVTFLSEHGRFLARVEGPVSGNVLLRRRQYQALEQPQFVTTIVRPIVLAKMANCRTVLQRALRDHPTPERQGPLENAVRHLGTLLHEVRSNESDLETLRGKEGEAANVYFGVFDYLITAQKDAFSFRGRSRRPPLDNINALLSFLYTLVAHDARSALETVGLDPQAGFLHALRPGRPSLALDLMEEFRAILADRLALSLINLRQVQGKGFEQTESGAVMMDEETRKIVLSAYQERKKDEIEHPFLGESVPVGLLMQIQARLLARHLRGDLDAYPPMFFK